MEGDFYPLMKVSLNGEYGVVTAQFWEVKSISKEKDVVSQSNPYKLYGLIRWDTSKEEDYEDWRGLWSSFTSLGGHEILQNFQFRFINDDGTFKK